MIDAYKLAEPPEYAEQATTDPTEPPTFCSSTRRCPGVIVPGSSGVCPVCGKTEGEPEPAA